MQRKMLLAVITNSQFAGVTLTIGACAYVSSNFTQTPVASFAQALINYNNI